MTTSKESQPRSQNEQPKFVHVLDRSRRVGISGDDTWRVGWRVQNKIVWHRHQDIWRVFRQNERVIQRFLGIPLNAEEVVESKEDSEFSASLPNLQDTLFILGETQKAEGLSRDITTIMSLSVNRRTPAQMLTEELTRLRDKFGPNVRNEHKLLAKQKLSEASSATNVADIQLSSLEAFDAAISRARQGMDIVSSLLLRGADILNWVDAQENTIEVLKNAVSSPLIEIRRAQEHGTPVLNTSVELWQSRFGGQTDVLDRAFKIHGNPYAQIVNRVEIQRLGNLKSAIEQRDFNLIQRRLENAYPILNQAVQDKKDREASGLFDRYRIRRPAS